MTEIVESAKLVVVITNFAEFFAFPRPREFREFVEIGDQISLISRNSHSQLSGKM